MQTRNKKYILSSNTLKPGEKQKDDHLKLSESSETVALKNLENKENLQARSVLQSKENHIPGTVTFRSRASNKERKLEKRSALKSKENNLKQKSPTFSEIDNYESKLLHTRGISGKNDENKENFVNTFSKTKGKENSEFTNRTRPLSRRAKIVPLSRKENIKELKCEERDSDSKILRRKGSEEELNNKEQGLRFGITSKINDPVLSEEKELSTKLTILNVIDDKISDSRKREITQCISDDQTVVLKKIVNKTNETPEPCRVDKETQDDKKIPVVNKGETLPVRAPSTRIRNKKNNSGSGTQYNIDDQTTVLNKDVNKMNEALESCRENNDTQHNEKIPIANKDDTLSIRAPVTRTRSRKINSAGSTEESNLDKITGSNKNVSKMNETPKLGIESTEAKIVKKSSSVNKGNTLPIRTRSVRIRIKKLNLEGIIKLSNLDGKTIGSVKEFKENETPVSRSENKELIHNGKPVVNKNVTVRRKISSARIRIKKANSEGCSQQNNLNNKDIISNNNSNINETADQETPVAETNISNRTPSDRIRNQNSNSEENETPVLRREKKELKRNGKSSVVSKNDTVPKKILSARIRSIKANSEGSSQQNNHNDKVSNNNTFINETPDQEIPVVKTSVLPNRTPSQRIRSQKTNSQEKLPVSNDSGKKVQFSEKINQSRLKEKVPVWKCKEVKKNTDPNSPIFDFKTKRRSNRVSINRKRDVYEFSFEGNEKFVIKKKRRKQQVRKKKLKPLKKGLLTTDPLFEPTIPSITTRTFYSSKIVKSNSQKPCNQKYSENHENNNSFDGEDQNFDDVTVDDAGYEASISVAESSCMSHINPVMSAMPTPNAHMRFPGPSSTPIVYDERYEYNSIVKSRNIVPKPHEEVKLCFGFDESDDENTSIGLSPVQNFRQLSHLHPSSIASYNVEEIEPIPTRFNLPNFKKPFPLINGKENTQLIHKKRCTSTKINHAKRRKLNEKSIVPDKDSLPPQPQDSNVSVLFEMENEVPLASNFNNVSNPNKSGGTKISPLPLNAQENNVSVLFDNEDALLESNDNDISSQNKYKALKCIQLPLKTQENNASILFDKENKKVSLGTSCNDDPNQNKKDLKCTQHPKILSPEKSFSKPPRKSYDRKSLEAARKNFIENFAGGYPTTDTGSDYEDPEPPYVRKRKKRMESQKENSAVRFTESYSSQNSHLPWKCRISFTDFKLLARRIMQA
ncbi:hypothetical protein Avbf_06781 [Armadillidium vulgare]|nr:hypothetical protein Avbf_06781 [Armadillidium vulgare]